MRTGQGLNQQNHPVGPCVCVHVSLARNATTHNGKWRNVMCAPRVSQSSNGRRAASACAAAASRPRSRISKGVIPIKTPHRPATSGGFAACHPTHQEHIWKSRVVCRYIKTMHHGVCLGARGREGERKRERERERERNREWILSTHI